jgi:flagellin
VTNTFVGTIRLTSTEAITLSGANEAFIGYADGSAMALGSSALNSVSVSTVANANTALGRIDSALSAVSSLRSTFGAIQNRFESTIASLSAVSENLEASRSRILDADFAAETAALTRAQILQQAGVAILAQANTAPQSVLALLQ